MFRALSQRMRLPTISWGSPPCFDFAMTPIRFMFAITSMKIHKSNNTLP